MRFHEDAGKRNIESNRILCWLEKYKENFYVFHPTIQDRREEKVSAIIRGKYKNRKFLNALFLRRVMCERFECKIFSNKNNGG